MPKEYGTAAPDANPELANQFLLEIDRIAVMAFEKVIIGASEFDVGINRTGIDPATLRTFSGLMKNTTIEIEKHLKVGGVADVKQFIDWHRQGSKERKSGAIALTGRSGEEIMRWNFTNAWVSKTDQLEFDASQETEPVTFKFTLSVSEIVLA